MTNNNTKKNTTTKIHVASWPGQDHGNEKNRSKRVEVEERRRGRRKMTDARKYWAKPCGYEQTTND